MVRIAINKDSRVLAEMAVQMWESHTVDELEAEFVEKFDNGDSYFVLRDNIGGLTLVLIAMLEVCNLKFKDQK